MSKEQQLMINGMNMLLRKFAKLSDNEVVTVSEIIKESNEVYDKILKMEIK